MNMSMGQSLGFNLSHELTHSQSQGSGSRRYCREALKAFKKFKHGGKDYYTCNVERLKECNRLGNEKEISLWRTHFFLNSRHFDEVKGVVFSSRPGNELTALSKLAVDSLFIAKSSTEILETTTGHLIELSEQLVFASAKVL